MTDLKNENSLEHFSNGNRVLREYTRSRDSCRWKYLEVFIKKQAKKSDEWTKYINI